MWLSEITCKLVNKHKDTQIFKSLLFIAPLVILKSFSWIILYIILARFLHLIPKQFYKAQNQNTFI